MKELLFEREAREHIKRGIDTIANAVKVTLGPRGRNVIIKKDGELPHVTKDGATVAKYIFLEDPYENIGAELIKYIAEKTSSEVGDATTTSTVLAQAMISKGHEYMIGGSNPIEIKKGIDLAVSKIVEYLKNNSKHVNHDDFSALQHIATISANGDRSLGSNIAEMFMHIKKEGTVTVQPSNTLDTSVRIIKGMSFDSGYTSPIFNNVDNTKVEYNNPYIFITTEKLQNALQIRSIMEYCAKEQRPLVIISDEISNPILSNISLNHQKDVVKMVTIKLPGYSVNRKNIAKDIAVFIGASLPEEISMPGVSGCLGEASKIIVTQNRTIIENGKGSAEDVKQRVKEIEQSLKKPNIDSLSKSKLEERIAKLSSGIAIFNIGAPTEIEYLEKKDRVDDAIASTRAALYEGISPGGSVAYINALFGIVNLEGDNEAQNIGISIVQDTLTSPFLQNIKNSGKNGEVVLDKIIQNSSNTFGYNVQIEEYGDMFEMGVVDPTKTIITALVNAASVAGMFLTTEVAIR